MGEITLQLGLVELRDQILAGSATPEAATKEENGLRSWIRAKLRGLNLGKYGTVTSTDCHRAAYSLWPDAQRLIAAAGAVLAWAWLRTPQATSDTTHTGELEHAAA